MDFKVNFLNPIGGTNIGSLEGILSSIFERIPGLGKFFYICVGKDY